MRWVLVHHGSRATGLAGAKRRWVRRPVGWRAFRTLSCGPAPAPAARPRPSDAAPRGNDEARFGRKGRVCHRWFARGRRPPGLCDRRYTRAHLFAAVRPATGDAFALVLPHVSTDATNESLARFGATLGPDEHAAVVLDGAGWHTANGVRVPGNVALVPLPPYAPELNPVERVWPHPRERHLSHRLLDGHDAVVGALCRAWNALTKARLRSLTSCPYLEQIRI